MFNDSSLTTSREKLIGFDLETTGIVIDSAEIVTATLVPFSASRGRLAGHRDWLLNCPGHIPAEATAIHGFDDAYVAAHGTDYRSGVVAIAEAIYQAWDRGFTLVGFNISYDLAVLRRAVPDFQLRGPVMDPSVIDRAIDTRPGKRTLTHVAEHYGFQFDPDAAHDATFDAEMACKITVALWDKLFDQVAINSDKELMEWQRSRRIQWQERLYRFLLGKGNDVSDFVVDYQWPLADVDTGRHAAKNDENDGLDPLHEVARAIDVVALAQRCDRLIRALRANPAALSASLEEKIIDLGDIIDDPTEEITKTKLSFRPVSETTVNSLIDTATDSGAIEDQTFSVAEIAELVHYVSATEHLGGILAENHGMTLRWTITDGCGRVSATGTDDGAIVFGPRL